MLFVITGSGCSSKNLEQQESISYETKVHKIQYQYAECGEFKLDGLKVQLEDPNENPGSKKNQEINTRNLILLDYKLKEAESLMRCYKTQTKQLTNIIDLYNENM